MKHRIAEPSPIEKATREMWEREAAVMQLVPHRESVHIADFTWRQVLPPPGYPENWTYPAITALASPNSGNYAVLIAKSLLLLGHPHKLRILAFDAVEARAMGLNIEAAQPQPFLSEAEVGRRLADAKERGAYVRFYVNHEGLLTPTQPPSETYDGIPIEDETTLTLRALAYWPRALTSLTVPVQGGNRLIPPAGDLRSFLPY